jgi:gluconokinase
MLIIVMGVCGSGKSTIASALASRLGWSFIEADDFHPAENVKKMRAGTPLTDADRLPWLQILTSTAKQKIFAGQSAVLACSALKESYRRILSESADVVKFVWLKGDEALIAERVKDREHFMSPALLSSQFQTLEEPNEALIIDILDSPSAIVENIIGALNLLGDVQHGIS